MTYTPSQKERFETLTRLAERFKTLILVEGVGDQAFLNGLIAERYPHLHQPLRDKSKTPPYDVQTVEFDLSDVEYYIEPSGSKEKVYSDAQLLAKLITQGSAIVVERLIFIRDGDAVKNESDYKQQYDSLFSSLNMKYHIHLVKDFQTNEFNDLERLIMSITKPDFQNAVTVKNEFIASATANSIQQFQKKQSKRELNVWLASLPDFEGRTDRLLLNKIEQYLDLTHHNLAPLYAILDPYFESSPNA
jgi:hypothetical protein